MMKFLLRTTIAIAVIAGVAAAAYQPLTKYIQERNQPRWRTAEVSRGRIVADVQSTGTVKPVLSVVVGSFVSGPITKLLVDFNQIVAEGDLMAKVDPLLFEADVARDEATLASRAADVERIDALLQQATRNEKRAIAIREENQDFISAREMDQIHFERMSLAAQLKLANAAVKQAEASLTRSRQNLTYTNIVSPVDGMVIERKIDRGQTLAAQFQAPELFIVAPDMDKEMHVFASVDEADIGLIIEAKSKGLPVEFRVDAYPADVFEGKIWQIRKNSTTTENVVTYPVIVSAPNPDLKLLPGMTASISFQVDERKDVLCVPNSALRFYPNKVDHVRPDDRTILTGETDEDIAFDRAHLSEKEREEFVKRMNRRHVWIEEGPFLKAIEIETGLTDLKYTELVAGELSEGDTLVIGEKTTELGG